VPPGDSSVRRPRRVPAGWYPGCHFREILDQAKSRSAGSRSGSVAAAGSARTTIRASVGVEPSRSAVRCRSRRFTRLRTTAVPTALETTKPTNGPWLTAPVSSLACSTRVRVPTRSPCRTVRLKSLPDRILTGRGSTEHHPWFRRNGGWLRASAGQSGAALAPTGGEDGATGSGPHPVTETMGTTAAPVARLEGALAHGFTPTFVSRVCKTVARWPGHGNLVVACFLVRFEAANGDRSTIRTGGVMVKTSGRSGLSTRHAEPETRLSAFSCDGQPLIARFTVCRLFFTTSLAKHRMPASSRSG
jgi:hypothetical protein